MVNNQARRLVPGSNLSELPQAFSKVSWTRSSASCIEPESEAAKARRFGISLISPSLKSEALIGRSPGGRTLLLCFQLRQQNQKFVGDRGVDQIVVMGLQRPADRFLH